MGSYDKELEIALAAVREAAKVCRSVQATITPDALEKKDKSPVTVADFASQALVCRALQDAFADDPVIGEEDAAALRGDEGAAFRGRVFADLQPFGVASEDDALGFIDRGGAQAYSERFWTLDPIDGTKGFLRGDQYDERQGDGVLVTATAPRASFAVTSTPSPWRSSSVANSPSPPWPAPTCRAPTWAARTRAPSCGRCAERGRFTLRWTVRDPPPRG